MRAEIEKAVKLLRDGDNASVEQVLALLQDTVFSFSMRVCGHRQDAEDTMQEVLLKSVPQLPKFNSPKALVCMPCPDTFPRRLKRKIGRIDERRHLSVSLPGTSTQG